MALSVCSTTAVSVARAQSPGTEAKQEAGRKFAEGESAFRAGDFIRAAEAFQAAYKAVPHHDALWNAARALQKAGELTQAANFYALYLRVSPADAADRPRAQTALAELAPKLGRIEINSPPESVVLVDAQTAQTRTVFVTPGAHTVKLQGVPRGMATVTVNAGAVVSIALPVVEVSSERAAPLAQSSHGTNVAVPDERMPSKGWSPLVTYVSGGLTLAAVGVTVWSGLDTLAARDAFDALPSQDNLDRGHQKQLRTNIGIGASIALGAFTLASAVFWVNWSSKSSTQIGLWPTGAGLRATF